MMNRCFLYWFGVPMLHSGFHAILNIGASCFQFHWLLCLYCLCFCNKYVLCCMTVSVWLHFKCCQCTWYGISFSVCASTLYSSHLCNQLPRSPWQLISTDSQELSSVSHRPWFVIILNPSMYHSIIQCFVNENKNKNGEKRENNEFVNEN